MDILPDECPTDNALCFAPDFCREKPQCFQPGVTVLSRYGGIMLQR